MTTPFNRIEYAGGVFVTGTDTEVGKTIACACLVGALDGNYWKPVQSGLVDGTDQQTVKKLSKIEESRFHDSVYELKAPLSPHEAARREKVSIEMRRFKMPASKRPIVVEGAGGVMVPLNARALMLDLMKKLKLPVIIVARSGLGTINHTVLTVQALRKQRCPVLGVIVNGPRNPANVEAIETYGRVPVLWQLTPLKPLNPNSVTRAAGRLARSLRK